MQGTRDVKTMKEHLNSIAVIILFISLSLLICITAHAGENERRLFKAAENGNIPLMKELLAKGADVNSFDSGTPVPLTPLMAATNWNYLEAVELLLKSGANPNLSSNNDGNTALHTAAGRDTRIVAALLSHGANPNARTVKFGYTPLGNAAMCNITLFTELKRRGGYRGPFPDCAETIRLLVRAGADVNNYRFSGDTPLILAVKTNSVEALKALIEAGADTNKKWDDSNVTPLMIALETYYEHKDISSIQLLLSHRADPNARDEGTFDDYDDYRVFPYWGGYTVLGFAARHGLLGAVRLLLKHGADPTLKRVDGSLPSDIARKHGHVETAVVIEQYMKLQPTKR